MAWILGRRVHDEDQGELGPRNPAPKEALEGHGVSVDPGGLHWGVPQGLAGASLAHHNHAHHLVPPAPRR